MQCAVLAPLSSRHAPACEWDFVLRSLCAQPRARGASEQPSSASTSASAAPLASLIPL
jgi:hypothetical protein